MTAGAGRTPRNAAALVVGGTRICLLVGVMLTMAVLTPDTARLYYWNATAGPQVSIGGPFMLRDGDGRTVTDQSFRGKYMLVYFGYTFCPDV